MKKPTRITRCRYSENDTPLTLPKFLSYEDGFIDVTEDFFLELVNQNDEVVGLFFLLNWGAINGMVVNNWLDFAKYYDDINAGEPEFEYWQLGYYLDAMVEDYGDMSREQIAGRMWDHEDTCIRDSYYGYFSRALISYGRVKHPYGLSTLYADKYKVTLRDTLPREDAFNQEYPGSFPDYSCPLCNEISWRVDEISNKPNINTKLCGEISELLDISIDVLGVRKLLFPKLIGIISEISFRIYSECADLLLSKVNIDLFIEASINTQNTEVTAYLLDYKNKNFPAEGKPS